MHGANIKSTTLCFAVHKNHNQTPLLQKLKKSTLANANYLLVHLINI